MSKSKSKLTNWRRRVVSHRDLHKIHPSDHHLHESRETRTQDELHPGKDKSRDGHSS